MRSNVHIIIDKYSISTFSMTQNITGNVILLQNMWASSFVPPELYDEIASLDGIESLRVQKEEEMREKYKVRERMEDQSYYQMSKENVKG